MKRPIAYLAGTGRGVPATVMTNFDFAKIGIETTDEWIVERTGIKERHIAKAESATDLAAMASRSAMEKAGVHPGELDIIVLGTASPDRLLPSAAVDLQAAIGAGRAAAFDVGAACSGFSLAEQLEARIAAGTMRRIAPQTFMVNLMALCIFPFAARPMLMTMLGLDDQGFAQFIARRRDELPAFFLGALRP